MQKFPTVPQVTTIKAVMVIEGPCLLEFVLDGHAYGPPGKISTTPPKLNI